MPKISRILAPVDFSAGSGAALAYALFFADRFGAEVEVLHVWEVPQTLRPDLMVWLEGAERQPLETILGEQAQREMAEFLDALAPEVRARVKPRTEQGNTVKTILHLAEREHFDLLVLGTHGRTGLMHVLMGSVAERVVRQAVCPVLTVRSPEPKADA
jgi:universal stress protein A